MVALHGPRPIHDKVSYGNTVLLIDRLAGGRLNKDQEDHLEILSQIVEAYEKEHVKPPWRIAGIELIRLFLAKNELTGNDLAERLGVNRPVAYKILEGSCNLTTEHVSKLANRFVISADALIA